MKVFRALVTVLLICALAAVAALQLGAAAQVTCSAESVPAMEQEQLFNNIVQSISEGTADKVMDTSVIGDIAEYSIATITVRVQNPGFLPMEWMTGNYIGVQGDIAVYDIVGLPVDIPAHGEIMFTITLLRRSDASGWGSPQINYYVAGRSITKTY